MPPQAFHQMYSQQNHQYVNTNLMYRQAPPYYRPTIPAQQRYHPTNVNQNTFVKQPTQPNVTTRLPYGYQQTLPTNNQYPNSQNQSRNRPSKSNSSETTRVDMHTLINAPTPVNNPNTSKGQDNRDKKPQHSHIQQRLNLMESKSNCPPGTTQPHQEPKNCFFIPCSNPSRSSRQSTTQPRKSVSDLTIATCNIEGVKSNSKYLTDLCKKFDIICLQEHWLYSFQQHELDQYLPNKHSAARSVDSVDDISSINLPRVKGGVSISWPPNISHLVKKLSDGNERILAIDINTETKLCIICTYLPTHNPSVHSIDEYSDCLDILFNIIFKFSDTHKIVIAGDFNAPLLASRSYNKHDEQFKKFILDLQLKYTIEKQSTFIHHNGNSQSQIDYILSTPSEILDHYKIHEMDPGKYHPPKSGRIIKKQWSNVDTQAYQHELSNLKADLTTSMSVEEKLQYVMEKLIKADATAVPAKIIKLQGPQWKASPSVLPLIKAAKTKHKEWVDKRKPNDISKTSKINAQRELRKQMRKEKYEDRQKIYSEIMQNPSMKKFYQLINRNRGQSKTSTTSILKGPNCDISDPKNEAKRFSQYMEDLFVPKDNNYDNTFLELSTVRTNAIDLIYDNMNIDLEPLSETEIIEAIGKLNTGKATDEFGISAEHLKTARSILSPIFTTIFNQIIATKQIPLFFKTGITNPVLKKLKDPTLVESYRGITVTPTITKLFEYVLLPRLTKNKQTCNLVLQKVSLCL
ncbi:unnamed protein product [Mytilus coruscus]|uniref:Endonuclease/exonuclease/phosphatase domain-containing protein n=1 Tax=Mytilus coruscus TaxID=42192 RepID=A0A6J8EM13_MYTCO|nr:unnamed protein product [Mytilus coruscus]